MVTIGVLGLQGAIREHVQSVEESGARAVIVKRVEQLQELDGLIIPGGESTTMRRLIDSYGFLDLLIQFGQAGKPIFGTCAGLILLAKEIEGTDQTHLGLMDIRVRRNAFGRQRESFEVNLPVKGIAEGFEAVFIRAPHIESVGEGVEVLATYNDKIVVAQEGHYLTCAFHPELTDDTRLVQHFVKMVENYSQTLASSN
ncbi:glutamine amidotransferase [Pontibacillus halophilus JSM 076056 = DSM 19796]|uniref:Pyridoxal 5'-phosphate synthase subunit PdxT n=1 Tax=Pontibacillus halophilus JSM 076056 = DSM 19796 TaxID=1385510 RepID=A0A0A5GK53_9BACI|nr:pyridoxal 5'-phosphate synthase glutaminase subunit PdxT [Pontibacillus halophilus]KGX93661.1 glutamine amidotransferase [Pontibacillus halophilus JSM 076056 = DSM 19796]